MRYGYFEWERDWRQADNIARIKQLQEEIYHLQLSERKIRLNQLRLDAENHLKDLFSHKISRSDICDHLNHFREQTQNLFTGTDITLWDSVQDEAGLYIHTLLNTQPHLHPTAIANIIMSVLPELSYDDLIMLMYDIAPEDFAEQHQQILEDKTKRQLKRAHRQIAIVIGAGIGALILISIYAAVANLW